MYPLNIKHEFCLFYNPLFLHCSDVLITDSESVHTAVFTPACKHRATSPRPLNFGGKCIFSVRVFVCLFFWCCSLCGFVVWKVTGKTGEFWMEVGSVELHILYVCCLLVSWTRQRLPILPVTSGLFSFSRIFFLSCLNVSSTPRRRLENKQHHSCTPLVYTTSIATTPPWGMCYVCICTHLVSFSLITCLSYIA